MCEVASEQTAGSAAPESTPVVTFKTSAYGKEFTANVYWTYGKGYRIEFLGDNPYDPWEIYLPEALVRHLQSDPPSRKIYKGVIDTVLAIAPR